MATTDGPPLETVLLRTFLEIVDSGSFAMAAEQLALTPSAVSGHMRRLEQIAGTSLLTRTTRRLALTQAGDTLYAYSRNILELEREARAKLQSKPLRGRLRIGASDDFATAWLPQVLKRFNQLHPEATIELKVGITADLLRQQERGRLDLVFGKHCSSVESRGTLLWEEPLVWAFSADQLLSIDKPIPLAVFPEPCVYRESAITALANLERAWHIVFESNSVSGCLSAARAGLAITVIADSQLSAGLRVLGSEHGLPELPAARFYAFIGKESPVCAAMVEAARRGGQHRFSERSLKD